MNPSKNIEPFPLTAFTTGKDLADAHLEYLKSTVETMTERTVSELIAALKSSSGSTLIDMSEHQWEQLANAALTIGSFAIDKITRRLTLQAAKYGWSQAYDYRPIATQIHAIATPARKIINGLNYRGKCVRAVLKVHTSEFMGEAGSELQNRHVTNLEQIQRWQSDSFALFEKDKSVNERFHSMYNKEWDEFCEEWNTSKIEMRYYSGIGFEGILVKYLKRLSEESSKSKIQWEPVLNFDGKVRRPDAVLSSGFMMDLKRKPDQLSFLINIPNLTNSDFNIVSLDLMDVIEQATGLKHVETGRDPRNNPDVLQVDIVGEFTMEQSKQALGEIDSYLMRRFPKG
jgi:predicted DNA binding CopG/RHH family protein